MLYVYHNPEESKPYSVSFYEVNGINPIRVIDIEEFFGYENFDTENLPREVELLRNKIEGFEGPTNCLDHIIYGEEE